MSISTPDLLIAVGVYATSIVLTLLWVHLSSQQSITRSARSYLGIATRMALVHSMIVLFCGYTGLPIRWVALPLILLVTAFPSRLAHEGVGDDALGFAVGMAAILFPYAIKQYILGFPDRELITPEPEVTIPDREQREGISRPRPSTLSGEIATVVAALKPSGKVRIGAQEHSASSEGSLFINAGEEVTVCGERKGTLVVRRIEAP